MKQKSKKEEINNPSHYNKGPIETIAYIKSLGIGEDFCIGNVIKYVSRYKDKGTPKQDLLKARWYLDQVINGFYGDEQ